MIKQTNAYAMQYAILFGAVGCLSLVSMGLSLSMPGLSFLTTLLMVGSPVLATLLTLRFRRQVMDPVVGFTFGRAFLFAFMMGIYAAIWVALFVLIYLSYIDGGRFFDAYEAMLTQPEVVAQMRQSGLLSQLSEQSITLTDVVDMMRDTAPARYAGMIIYSSILVTPIFSAIIGLVVRRAPQLFSNNNTADANGASN